MDYEPETTNGEFLFSHTGLVIVAEWDRLRGMKALVFTGIDAMEIKACAEPELAAGEALVRVKAAALNHRDAWIKQGQYAGLKWPVIPGSDGAGVVTAVGSAGDAGWIGREVLINPSLDWGEDAAAQSGGFSILGLPRDGTFAESVCVPVSQLSGKPAHLTWAEAAALPLAGLTAWRALKTRAQLAKGERLLVSGIGGGVALFALQFAVSMGVEAWVTSSSGAKISEAVRLGARGGFEYVREGWAKRAIAEAGLFDVIVDSAGGSGFESLVDLAAPGGRIVFYGATRGNPPMVPQRKLFWRQLSLLGSTMGSPADWAAMLEFVERTKLRPVVSREFPLAEAADAFALMERGGQFGKIVLAVDV